MKLELKTFYYYMRLLILSTIFAAYNAQDPTEIEEETSIIVAPSNQAPSPSPTPTRSTSQAGSNSVASPISIAANFVPGTNNQIKN
jgi:hypothetical protein